MSCFDIESLVTIKILFSQFSTALSRNANRFLVEAIAAINFADEVGIVVVNNVTEAARHGKFMNRNHGTLATLLYSESPFWRTPALLLTKARVRMAQIIRVHY